MDEFGRLPTDVLKHIMFLGTYNTAPYFTYHKGKDMRVLTLHIGNVKQQFRLSIWEDRYPKNFDAFFNGMQCSLFIPGYTCNIEVSYNKEYCQIKLPDLGQIVELPTSVLASLKQALQLYNTDVIRCAHFSTFTDRIFHL
jgi:hypothetical protein